MLKFIFLEGLPGVGKTTITNYIESLKLTNVHIVNEIENQDIINNINTNQNIYIENDNIKLSKYQEGIIIIDRGPISTLSYNETKNKLTKNPSLNEVTTWFNSIKDIYLKKETSVIYLKNKHKTYHLPYQDNKDPYGTIENQKLLEDITLNNCHNYVKNLKIVDYDYNEMEALVNEIIN